MCINEIWGLISDHGWDDNDSTVVCRQLGYGPHGENICTILSCVSIIDTKIIIYHRCNTGGICNFNQ